VETKIIKKKERSNQQVQASFLLKIQKQPRDIIFSNFYKTVRIITTFLEYSSEKTISNLCGGLPEVGQPVTIF